MRFSFIGLGNMGRPLAENIMHAGEDLTIWSSNPQTVAHFKELGAKIVANKEDLADCDVLCTCVPRPEDVKHLVLGALYAHMHPGSAHLEFSTIDPATAEELAAAAASRKIGYVQATVSKTPAVAVRGEAPFFVGGLPEAVNKVYPVLEKIGKPHKVGTVKAACAIKILSNQMGMAALSVVAEGLKIGSLMDIDLTTLLNLLLDTGAASFQMKTRGPWIIDADYKARFAVDLALKDLRLGEKMLESLGYEPKIIAQTQKYMNEAQAAGLGAEDMCAIYQIIDR